MSTAHKLSSKLRTIPSREVGADDIAVGIHHNIDSRRLSSDPGRWEYQWSINDMLNDADINILAGWDEYLSDKYCENSSRSNVVVAVIDTGVDYNHPDLIDMMWRNPNEIPDNGIDDDGNGIIDDIHGVNFGQNPPSGDPMDLDSHGTHCAGVIAAKQDNDQGIAGVASYAEGKVKIMALKGITENGTFSGTFSALLKCLEYAIEHGSTVSSNSWGTPCNETFCPNVTQELEDVWKTVLYNNPNHLFIASAGNMDKLIQSTIYKPLNCGLQAPNLLCVAASNLWNQKSSYSNYGDDYVHVFAPGDFIYSTYLNNTYDYSTGTSMSCPHVSALAALIRTMRSDLNAYDVRRLIESNVKKRDSYTGFVSTGGIIDAERTIQAARKEGKE